jgi:hypothetical protein
LRTTEKGFNISTGMDIKRMQRFTYNVHGNSNRLLEDFANNDNIYQEQIAKRYMYFISIIKMSPVLAESCARLLENIEKENNDGHTIEFKR